MKRWLHAATDSTPISSVDLKQYGEDVTDMWFIQSDDGVDNCCIQVKDYEKSMRGRSALICLRVVNDDIYVMCKANEDDYGVPGGGWNRGENPKDAALRELHEETFTDADNIVRMGTLIEYHEEVKDWVKEHVANSDDWWYGYYSAIFVGTYTGKFYGEVAEEDRESGYRWELLDSVEDEFPIEYKTAVDEYLVKYYKGE